MIKSLLRKQLILTNVRQLSENIRFTSYEVINSLSSKPHIVNGREEWSSYAGKIINDKIVVLKQMGDIHPYENPPKFSCETIMLDQCDKNFVYYWLDSSVFTNVKNIFLLSHPCESNFFLRWYYIQNYYPTRTIPNIFLAHYYERYKNRWARGMENVIILDEDNIKNLTTKIRDLSQSS
jgi:hypothetical protein